MSGSAHIIRGNARDLPMPDNSVDLIVTSPPYFALRSYQDGGSHYAGQIGDEPTPAAFVDSLLEVTRECVRVLKPSGSLWVNLGDKYSGAQAQNTKARTGDDAAATWRQTDPRRTGIPNKSLMGIPWRYALRCIDDLGLILRAEVIWSKPNGLPESVTDRVRRSHEQWFHFTLSPRYFSAVDEIREAHGTVGRTSGKGSGQHLGSVVLAPQTMRDDQQYNPLGKFPGSVWTIPTQPLTVPDHLGVDHFAAFPMEWPRRIIAGWSPAGVCVECGEGRRPVVDAEPRARFEGEPTRHGLAGVASSRSVPSLRGGTRTVTGYACACRGCTCGPNGTPDECAAELAAGGWCPRSLHPTADTTPAVVLDPFGGTGTTALVAKALGRTGISVDMSADYCRLAQWRTTDPDQLAKAMQVEKPPKQVEGQLGFEFEVGA